MDWKKYMSFNISNKLAIIGSLKIFISLLGSLIKHLGKYGFKYFSQEIDSDVNWYKDQ